MGNFIKTQNSFSCGEVAPDFYAINNIHGVSKLENMDILSSGALKRRKGLKRLARVADDAVLVPFIINENEKYLLVIYNQSIDIYQNDIKIAVLTSPWNGSDLYKLQYAQRFNTLYFVHPDYRPQMLTKNENGFSVSVFHFDSNPGGSVNMPFAHFSDTDGISISISPSTIDNNHAVFTTDADIWSDKWIGVNLLVNDRQWTIESVQNARTAIVFTNGAYSLPGEPITYWSECAFGNMRGWPISISFHQNRLIFAGSASAPNNIWMSKTGQYHNFNVGTGLDDEAIFVSLLSAQHHQISTIVSSDTLQILTSVGEWAISNSPLTPSNINIKQHTSVGSVIDRYLPPQQIEGRTVFISKGEQDIRELDMDELSQNYNATDLCVYSKHLMQKPISISYNQNEHHLYVVMQNGNIAVLNRYSNTDVSGWGTYKTDGNFKYVLSLDGITYVIVGRDNKSYLEKFDDTYLDDDGYNFSFNVSAMPLIVNNHSVRKSRARKVSVRMRDTKTLFVNGFRMDIPNDVYAQDCLGYNGDLSMNLLGTQMDTMQPIWVLSSNEQFSTTLLSVTIDGWYLI